MKYNTEGERIVREIRSAMTINGMNAEMLSKKTKIPLTSIYSYFKKPDAAPFGRMMKLAYSAGIKNITVRTGQFIMVK